MKKITLITMVILIMMIFSGSISHSSDLKLPVMKAEISFSDTLNNKKIFSVSNALEKYIVLAKPSIKVYYYTKKYCNEFDIHETIAFRIVKLETSYNGPENHNYNPSQISESNALGPYQLLLSTAKDMYVLLELGTREQLTRQMLLDDVELNVMLGIRYLRWVHDNITKDWKLVCGFYNTGKKKVNKYALYATEFI